MIKIQIQNKNTKNNTHQYVFVEGATNGFADPIRSSTGKRWEHMSKEVKITIDGLKDKNAEVKGFPDENSGADVVLEDLCDVNNSLQQVMI